MAKSTKKTEEGKQALADGIKPPEIVTETAQVEYHFTGDEIAAMNNDLLGHMNIIDDLERQAKQAAADFKLRAASSKNAIAQLRNKLTSKSEPRAKVVKVTFDPPNKKKSLWDPESGAFIRTEDMTPADWQLPLFKEPKKEEPAKAPTPPAEKPVPLPGAEPEFQNQQDGEGKLGDLEQTGPMGTNLGNVLGHAVADKPAALIVLDLSKDDWTAKGLIAAYKKSAKESGWDVLQIDLIAGQLEQCERNVARMKQVLQSHCVALPFDQDARENPPAPPAPATEDPQQETPDPEQEQQEAPTEEQPPE